jgi:hypothetical protein
VTWLRGIAFELPHPQRHHRVWNSTSRLSGSPANIPPHNVDVLVPFLREIDNVRAILRDNRQGKLGVDQSLDVLRKVLELYHGCYPRFASSASIGVASKAPQAGHDDITYAPRPFDPPISRNKTPILVAVFHATSQAYRRPLKSIDSSNASGMQAVLATSRHAPLSDVFKTAHLMRDPSAPKWTLPDCNVKARGCFLFSSIAGPPYRIAAHSSFDEGLREFGKSG